VDRLIEAGAVILGTTNCPEFLMAYETENLAVREHAESVESGLLTEGRAEERLPRLRRECRQAAWAATAGDRCASPRISRASAR